MFTPLRKFIFGTNVSKKIFTAQVFYYALR